MIVLVTLWISLLNIRNLYAPVHGYKTILIKNRTYDAVARRGGILITSEMFTP